MGRYVLRRLLLAVPVVLGVSVAVFLMASAIPGDPATVLAGDTASAEQVERIRHDLGLDQPLPIQYLHFLDRLAHGSLGESTRTHREVLIAILGIIVFSLDLHWLPVSGAFSPASYVLPTVTLSLHSAAVKARITRSSMLEVLGHDYLRTARAKGLRENTVIWRHALRNALIPVSTIVGLQFGSLLGGAFIIETIFGWPG